MKTKNSETFEMSLRGDREIVMARLFDAPRALVWDALTRPEHLARWWGLRRHAISVDSFDLRVGGKWRIVQREPDGSEAGFRGEFLELRPPERLALTFEYEPMAGHIVTETTTLEPRDGKTLMTRVSAMQSPEEREGIIGSGMEEGTREVWDRLEETLAELRNTYEDK